MYPVYKGCMTDLKEVNIIMGIVQHIEDCVYFCLDAVRWFPWPPIQTEHLFKFSSLSYVLFVSQNIVSSM